MLVKYQQPVLCTHRQNSSIPRHTRGGGGGGTGTATQVKCSGGLRPRGCVKAALPSLPAPGE